MEFFNTWIEKGIIKRLSVWVLAFSTISINLSTHCLQLSPVSPFALFQHFLRNVADIFNICIHPKWFFFQLYGHQDVVEKKVVQLTYTDAIELLLKTKKKFEFPVSIFTFSLYCVSLAYLLNGNWYYNLSCEDRLQLNTLF